MDGGGTLRLRAVVVLIPLLLVIAGDVETNPGPGGKYCREGGTRATRCQGMGYHSFRQTLCHTRVSFPCLPTMFHVMDQKLDSGKAWEQGYHILNVVLLTASVRTGEERFPSHDEAPLFSM